MKTLTIPLRDSCPFVQETAAAFSNMLSHYDSSVLIRDNNRTINAKSLLGLLSLGHIASGSLSFVLDGGDEDTVEQALLGYFK